MYRVIVSNIKEEPVTGNEVISSYVWGTYRTRFWANIWARDITDGGKDDGWFSYVEKV